MDRSEQATTQQGERIYIRVLEYLKAMINEKKLAPGDKIPTERVMAEVLSASRNSIREALKIMENMGIIETRQGSGSYLCANAGKGFTESLSMLLLTCQTDYLQVSQVRRALEIQAFALALEKIREGQLAALSSALGQMDLASLSDQTDADKEFHDAVILASGNFLICQIMQALSGVCRDFINYVLETASGDDRKALLASHAEIYKSLCEKDLARGLAAIHTHYDLIDKLLGGNAGELPAKSI